MIGNGVCDEVCYNEGCHYDRDDCECAKGCFLNQSSMDYCSDECMDLRCDQYNDVKSCTDITKKKQNFYVQMLSRNFDTRFSQQDCFTSDSSCSENDLTYNRSSTWRYSGQCQTDQCAYLHPYYNTGTSCSTDCSICVNSYTCLECKPSKFQYFTECLDSCPSGYESISLSFLSHQVCIGKE
jgi:hypothetical protein